MLRIRIDKTAKAGRYVEKRNCNLDCIWCHSDYFIHDGFYAIDNDMFITMIRKIIHVTKEDEIFVRIAGNGEPTMVGSVELSDLVRKLRKLSEVKKITLTTNGVNLSKMIKQLIDEGLDSVTISLNSLQEESYFNYSSRNFLSRVLGSIEEANHAGIETKINTIYWAGNRKTISAYKNLSADYGGMIIKFFDLLVLDNKVRSYYLPLDILEDELKKKGKVIEIREPYAKKIYKFPSGAVIEVKIASKLNTCPNVSCISREICLEGCRNSIRLSMNGTMKPCGVRDDNELLVEDSIHDEKIWDSLHSGGKIGF